MNSMPTKMYTSYKHNTQYIIIAGWGFVDSVAVCYAGQPVPVLAAGDSETAPGCCAAFPEPSVPPGA